MLIEVKEKSKQILNNRIAANIFKDILSFENEVDQDKEHFWVIGLNSQKNILYVELVSLGTLCSSLISPREVFRMAIFRAADCILAGHNHPSGNLKASQEDKETTERLKKSGNILQIPLIDHIIIAKNNDKFYSFEGNSMAKLKGI